MESLVMLIIKQLAPVFVPFIVGAVKRLLRQVPNKWIPVLVALGSAAVGAVNAIFGTNFNVDVATWTTDTIQAVFVGLAGVGVHQIFKQLKKRE